MLQFSFFYFFCCVCVKYYVGIPYAKIIVFVFRLLCHRGSPVCSSEANRAADTLMSLTVCTYGSFRDNIQG